MKIAICLSGFLRTFDQYFIHNINNLNITDYDLFISTYDIIGTSKNWNSPINTDVKTDLSIFNKYNTKKLLISKYDSTFNSISENIVNINRENNITHSPSRTLSMFNNIFLANELKKQSELEENFKYDIVIRMRPDILINNNVNINNLDLNKIYIESIAYKGCSNSNNMTNDLFAISNSDTMDYYSSLIKHVDTYTKTIPLHPETILHHHLKQMNVELYNFNIEIKR